MHEVVPTASKGSVGIVTFCHWHKDALTHLHFAQNWPEDEDNQVTFRYLCGNVDHSGALEEAGVTDADAIIIGPADDLPDNEVSLHCLAGITHKAENSLSCIWLQPLTCAAMWTTQAF